MLLRKTTNRSAERGAFTLMEVLVVVAILVVLASVGSVYFFRILEENKVTAARLKMQSIETVAKQCQLKPEFNGQFPATLDDMAPWLESADALLDPWGQRFQYDPSGQNNGGRKPDISTTAPDGTRVCNWAQ